MSVFGVILIGIFPHLDWIRRDTPYLSVFSPGQDNSEYGHFLCSGYGKVWKQWILLDVSVKMQLSVFLFVFFGKPEVLYCRRMVNLGKWNESEDSKITQVSQWFPSYITELNETILRKSLNFSTGFNDPASFDEQFFSLDFSPNEVLPGLLLVPLICFFLWSVPERRNFFVCVTNSGDIIPLFHKKAISHDPLRKIYQNLAETCKNKFYQNEIKLDWLNVLIKNLLRYSIMKNLLFPQNSGLTLSWRRTISNRESIHLQSKSMDWFLYDIGLRHERVNCNKLRCCCNFNFYNFTGNPFFFLLNN